MNYLPVNARTVAVSLLAKDNDCVHKLKQPNPPIMRHTMLHIHAISDDD